MAFTRMYQYTSPILTFSPFIHPLYSLLPSPSPTLPISHLTISCLISHVPNSFMQLRIVLKSIYLEIHKHTGVYEAMDGCGNILSGVDLPVDVPVILYCNEGQ